MSSAGAYDFTLRQGNTDTILFRCKDENGALFDLTGSEIVFRATTRGSELIRKTTADSGLLMPTPTNGEVTLPISVDDSRDLPLGKITSYEIERRIAGGQRTLVAGMITGIPGENDDD